MHFYILENQRLKSWHLSHHWGRCWYSWYRHPRLPVPELSSVLWWWNRMNEVLLEGCKGRMLGFSYINDQPGRIGGCLPLWLEESSTRKRWQEQRQLRKERQGQIFERQVWKKLKFFRVFLVPIKYTDIFPPENIPKCIFFKKRGISATQRRFKNEYNRLLNRKKTSFQTLLGWLTVWYI